MKLLISVILVSAVVFFLLPIDQQKRFLRNWLATTRGYGGCNRCGDTWDWKASKTIDYEYDKNGNATSGCFPLCLECYNKLTYEAALPYYINWYIKWHDTFTDEVLENISQGIAKDKDCMPWHPDMIKERFIDKKGMEKWRPVKQKED